MIARALHPNIFEQPFVKCMTGVICFFGFCFRVLKPVAAQPIRQICPIHQIGRINFE